MTHEPWWNVVHWNDVGLGLLAVAAAVAVLALALSGLSVGVLLILAAVECLLYWLWRTQKGPSPTHGPRAPYLEPTTAAH